MDNGLCRTDYRKNPDGKAAAYHPVCCRPVAGRRFRAQGKPGCCNADDTAITGTSMAIGEETYDVIVVGAGPAGCSAAYFAAQEGFKVVLVEYVSNQRNITVRMACEVNDLIDEGRGVGGVKARCDGESIMWWSSVMRAVWWIP